MWELRFWSQVKGQHSECFPNNIILKKVGLFETSEVKSYPNHITVYTYIRINDQKIKLSQQIV